MGSSDLSVMTHWCASVGEPWTFKLYADGTYRLLYERGKVLYCPPRREGLSAWVDIAERDDEPTLQKFGTSARGYVDGPSRSKQGMRLVVNDLRGLLAWCYREAPRRPRLTLR